MDTLIVLACWIVGGTLGGLVLHKGFHAGWWTVTLKKPLDVRMSEPEPSDITVQDLLRQRVHKPLRSGYQRGYRR